MLEIENLSLSILVVEDEPDIRSILQDRLSFLGFYVTLAKNGAEGIAILERMTIDGILLEIHIPVMDGLTMLKQTRDRYPLVPVIVMSIKTNKEKLIQAIELGAKDYLLKPINVDLLSKKCNLIFSERVRPEGLEDSP